MKTLPTHKNQEAVPSGAASKFGVAKQIATSSRQQIGGAVLSSIGVFALGVVLFLTLGAVFLVWQAGSSFSNSSAGSPGFGLPEITRIEWRALHFTLIQASLSALLSVVLAIPVARALSRQRFRGRRLVVALMGAPFLLPVIVAILGIVAIWGRSGPISAALQGFGFDRLDIYGLGGVLLAHVFFNLPLAGRILLQGYSAVPPERWRLAAQLDLRGWHLFRAVEWPVIRSHAPGALALIFLVCATSFAVVLSLGGGPKATTLELAIYQALRFDFDLGKAAVLALMQFGLCLTIGFVALWIGTADATDRGLGAVPKRWDGRSLRARVWDYGWLCAVGLFLFLPMLSVIMRGAPELWAGLPNSVWAAVWRSVWIAIVAALLSMSMALALGRLVLRLERHSILGARMAEAISLLTLAAPPFVMGMGLFLALRYVADPFALALPVTAIVNAMMALPFALRLLLPAMRRATDWYGPLSAQLGLFGIARFRHMLWPIIRKPACFATGLCAAMAAGDLGVIALFAPADQPTLPLKIHQLMDAYHLTEAAGASLLLLGLSFGLFLLFDRLGGKEADLGE